jgi:tRNA(Ile)-lysidine synthase
MFQQFSRHVKSKALFSKQDRLLLAISGGIDSVVLCHLLKRFKVEVTLAHCNYKLRGKDSDADETFCRKLAADFEMPIRVKVFDVSTEKKGSLQEKARKARYTWFRELLQEHGLNFIVTAHHAADQAETLLLNMVRGTGLKGMRGIAEKDGVLLRPLLPFTRAEITSYAKEHKIKYRSDKSNAKITYRRNFIRHKIMPLLKEINPSIETTLAADAERFRDEYSILSGHLSEISADLVTKENGEIRIDIAELRKKTHVSGILHLLLEPLGFNSTQVQKVTEHIQEDGLPGKKIMAASYRLTIDRNKIIVQKKAVEGKGEQVLDSEQALEDVGNFKIQPVDSLSVKSKNELIVAPSRLQWPLVVRGVRRGDRFRPFGMKGKKLLSDYLREQKLNAFEKEKVRLLENGNGEIIWVIGHRSDERYRVEADDKTIIKITFIE